MLFKSIIGQAHVKARLIQSVQENRVSHAQLFLGPEGSGNLALAIAYAQYLSCEKKQDDDSCGTCSSCIKYSKLVHPDLHFSYPVANTKEISSKAKSIDFIKNWRAAVLEMPYLNLNEWYEYIGIENKQALISVEDATEIIRKLNFKSFESEYKVMIIWMPEKLRTEAANTLLKILEEPPAKTLFILVAENHDQLIKTILSRTQIVKIPRLSDADLVQYLSAHFDNSSNDIKRIVHLCNGNCNEALHMVQKEQSNNLFELFQQWMRLCYKRDHRGLLLWGEGMSKTGREKQKSFLSYSLHIIRECLVLNYAAAELVFMDGEDLSFAHKFKAFIHFNNGQELSDKLNEAHFHIERNANPKILFMDLSLGISSLLQIKA
jgi:DNA polymerase-3 subunit delta'